MHINIDTDRAGQAQPKKTAYDLMGTVKSLVKLHESSNIHFITNHYSTTAHAAIQCIAGMDQRITDQKGHLAQLSKDNAKLSREYNEIRDAYMEVSEKNAQQAKQLAALRIAIRELTSKDPAPTGTAETAQEVPQPKDNPEKTFEERRGCGCGCDMHVSVLKEDELPPELQAVLKQIREFIK